MVFSRDLVPARFARGRSCLGRRLLRGSIYEVLERVLGVVVHHGVATFAPVRAPRLVAAKLRVPKGTLMLYLRQLDFDENGVPVLSSHEHHLSDAFEFSVVRRGPGRRYG